MRIVDGDKSVSKISDSEMVEERESLAVASQWWASAASGPCPCQLTELLGMWDAHLPCTCLACVLVAAQCLLSPVLFPLLPVSARTPVSFGIHHESQSTPSHGSCGSKDKAARNSYQILMHTAQLLKDRKLQLRCSLRFHKLLSLQRARRRSGQPWSLGITVF